MNRNKTRTVTDRTLDSFRRRLQEEEKSGATVERYMRDLARFQRYAAGRPVTKELTMSYKEELKGQFALSSVNSMLASLNHFFDFLELYECRVKQLKRQRRVYCPAEQELSRDEYYLLLDAARVRGRERMYLILQTICSTGIRVSELEFITVEAVMKGIAEPGIKGKNRQVWIPRRLQEILLEYCLRNRIGGGPVFVTRTGTPVNRSNVWKEMKTLCKEAGVDVKKVFPHNLRHLFAKTYYQQEKDIARLADLLGHSSINTTRIYIISSGDEHRQQIENMGLLL